MGSSEGPYSASLSDGSLEPKRCIFIQVIKCTPLGFYAFSKLCPEWLGSIPVEISSPLQPPHQISFCEELIGP